MGGGGIKEGGGQGGGGDGGGDGGGNGGVLQTCNTDCNECKSLRMVK